ncbi:hypothetical protein R1sor_005754 [Riccia sorocarpa]|uniref:Short-chain dehydrogenase/reductase n=1 Tax=Riccia sorocarpa TaxID=122646 RepID=A0ABD3HKF3_9MARC
MGGTQTKEADESVVLITGCSDGGIGSALAKEFAAAGCQVVATARSLSSMAELSVYPNVQPKELDVTDFDMVKAVVQSVEQENGRIDILVNNAGMPCVAPVAELPLPTLEKSFKTNVFGPVALIQAVFPGMAARGKGKIVTIGSINSYSYGPWAGGYVSSKAAIEALTDALRMELKPFGLQVMLVLPGAITSNFGKNSQTMTTSSVIEGLQWYRSWKAVLYKRGGFSQGSHSTSSQELAQKTVEKALSRKLPPHFAYGRFSSIFTLLHYLPLWITDMFYCKLFDLNRKAAIEDTRKHE